MYLTLDQIKKHLNINADFHADDSYLTDLSSVVENMVQKHIDRNLEDLEDGEGHLPSPLLQAMLLLTGTLYANRESVAFASAQPLPHAYDYVIALYHNYNGAPEGTDDL